MAAPAQKLLRTKPQQLRIVLLWFAEPVNP
jgi:hypothetical protein